MVRGVVDIVLMVMALIVAVTCDGSHGPDVPDLFQHYDNLFEFYNVYYSLTYKFPNYNPFYRPNRPYPNPVPVSVEATLLHIRDIDVRKRELEAVVKYVIQWYDDRLHFNDEEFTVPADLNKVWFPHMVYDNSIKVIEQRPNPKVYYTFNGMVTWKKLDTVTTFCRKNSNQNFTCKLVLDFPIMTSAFANVSFVQHEEFTFRRGWNVQLSTVNQGFQSEFIFDLTA